jgi:DNA-binding NarL/FixJ family response regulator
MENLRVFLVDDHPLMRMALRRVLESDQRFVVVGESDTAEECLSGMNTIATDLVVMDIQLPGIDGVEATRRLKSQHPELKVVIISAYGEEYLIPSIDAGADGYMMKGLEPKAMVEGLLQAAEGTPPIDSNLTRHLMDRAAAGPMESSGPSLSDRQQEVLKHVSDGLSTKEIASLLSISNTTLKRYFRNIFEVLGVNDRAHAIAEAYRRELI